MNIKAGGTARSCDIAVIGGGMVGTSLACALSQSGHWNTVLIDPVVTPPCPTPLEARVVALTRASERWLQGIDCFAGLERQPYRRMVVWDGEGTGRIEMNSADLGETNLGNIIANSEIVKTLRDKAEAIEGLTVLKGESLVAMDKRGDSHRLQLSSGQVIDATLVVGADGGRSKVRELCGFKTRQWAYGQRALVTTIRSQLPHQNTAWQCFLPTGPLALLPLTDPYHCAIVWSLDDDQAQTLLALDAESFARRLTGACEGILGELMPVSPLQSFPLLQQHATAYVTTGCALVGDAAHTIHPLAGQGANLGFLDARALLVELQRAHARHLKSNDWSVLRRYQRARKAHNLAMMAMMEGFKRTFGSRQPALAVLRNLGLNGANQSGVLKKQLIRQALGV